MLLGEKFTSELPDITPLIVIVPAFRPGRVDIAANRHDEAVGAGRVDRRLRDVGLIERQIPGVKDDADIRIDRTAEGIAVVGNDRRPAGP